MKEAKTLDSKLRRTSAVVVGVFLQPLGRGARAGGDRGGDKPIAGTDPGRARFAFPHQRDATIGAPVRGKPQHSLTNKETRQ